MDAVELRVLEAIREFGATLERMGLPGVERVAILLASKQLMGDIILALRADGTEPSPTLH